MVNQYERHAMTENKIKPFEHIGQALGALERFYYHMQYVDDFVQLDATLRFLFMEREARLSIKPEDRK